MSKAVQIGLWRGRWYLYRGGVRTKMSWKTQEEARAFMWRIVKAQENAD